MNTHFFFPGKILIFKIVTEIDTIPGFIVFQENMTQKMILDFPIHDTKTPEMYQNTTTTDKGNHKTVMIGKR